MPKAKTATQLICREVFSEASDWRAEKNPSPEMLKKGIILLLRRRLDVAGITYLPSQLDSYMGGVLSMFRKAERDAGGRFSHLQPTLAKTVGVSLSGFLHPIEVLQEPPSLSTDDFMDIAAARAAILAEGEGEIDFLSHLEESSKESDASNAVSTEEPEAC